MILNFIILPKRCKILSKLIYYLKLKSKYIFCLLPRINDLFKDLFLIDVTIYYIVTLLSLFIIILFENINNN